MRLIVVGAGAAGVFCAANAARLNRDLEVILIEQSSRLLSKVRISGGGRCNLTHACFDIQEMVRKYPRGGNFLKKAFHQFFTTDTIKWFGDRGLSLKTEADGRIFPASDNSESVIRCLINELDNWGVTVMINRKLVGLRKEGAWELELQNGERLTADFVCIACGGFPKASMFDWLVQTGHSIQTPVPSLFTFNLPNHPVTVLQGISVNPARIRISGTKLIETAPLLITHWGLSGPAVLRLSAWGARLLAERNYQFSVSINWLPEIDEQQIRTTLSGQRHSSGAATLGNRNIFKLPQRLWEYFLGQSGINNGQRWAELGSDQMRKLVQNLSHSEYSVQGKTSFKEEFVTAGGISLSEIDPQTMESRKVPQLFFAGEIMDIDGITGGFNFQHAWTSGWIAARAIASMSV